MRAVQRTAALRFELLGHIRAYADGVSFRMATPRKTPQLLTYLLLHRGATVSRDFLAFLFWPEDTEESARSKLRSNIFDLTRMLPRAPQDQPWIFADGTGIRWNLESEVSIDVADFESAIAARDLEGAVTFYAGDLLEGMYDEWLLAPRERLRSAYLGALSELISQARRRLDYPTAMGYAKRLLNADPLREDVVRRLVALRYETGDRAGALEEFRRFSDHLRTELGIEPMPETVVLHAAIVKNEALPAAEREHGDLAVTEKRKRPLLPFVGREDELNRLLEGWGRATRGRGSIAFIDGAPGIGKSRLVEELSRTVEERGGRVLAGTTGFPEALPYQALVEALRDALPILASTQLDPTTLAVLATLLPELSHLVEGLGLPRPLAPERERARTLTALAHAFVAIAQPRALLLVLEDLHWSQDATTAALGVLARRTPLTQIFVVATYRDGDLPRKHSLRALRGEALRARWASGVTLGPLGSEDVAEIVRRVSPLVEPSAELHAACAGNPLLLDQLLAAPTTPLQAKGVRIGAIVGAQLERLSSHARSFAEIAALVGARFSHEVVRESGGWDNASANDALDELLDRKIVNEAGGYGDFDYAFAHQLVCDIVLENAPPRRAADRHRRIARALEALYPERKPEFATQLARHYESAHEPERAGANYVIAGHRALVMSALEEAHAHLRRGMDLSTDAKARADAFIDLYELSRRQGGPSDAAAALAGLDDAVERLNDAEYRRTAALLRARLSSSNNDAAATGAARERLRKLAADAGPRWEALYRIEEASAAMHRAEFERADTESQQALSAARASGDFPAIARALILVARLRRDTGDVDSALALLQESVETAFRAGDGAIELDALMLAHLLSYEDERFSLFVPTAERWLERAINLGDRYAEDLARVRLAMALVAMRRDVARAVEELRKPIDVSESGSHLGLGRLQQNRGIVFSELGDFSEAIACFEDANAHFKAVDDTIGCAITFSGLALIHAWAGDPQLGRQQALAALELVPRYEAIHTGARDNLAVTVALCGDLDEAIALGTQVLADLQRLSGKRWYPRLLADLALWNAQSGDLRSARDYVEKLLAGTLPITTEKPQSCPWTAAQVLRACGDGTRARAELERAYNLVAPLAEQLTGDARARFVTVPWNREIIAAYERDEWPTFGPFTRSG